jgi:hypothetical protein
VVGCYPRRWKQRYAEELLDVLDQHRAGPRTVFSLAGGALSTHLDPDYRMAIRLMPRLSREAKISVAVSAALIVGLPALVIVPMIPRAIRESRWQPSSSDSVAAIAFSRDQRMMVSATGGPPWEATSTLWDITDQARPQPLSVFEGGSPATISPDGATVAANAGGGKAEAALWNVSRPRHPARLAVLSAGLPGALWGAAFSPDGRILAAASTSGLALWDVAGPARPRLLRSLGAAPLVSDNPGPVPFGVGQGDLAFSPDGRTLASVSGSDQVTVWDVTRPDRATRIATLAGPRDYFAALAFSPGGNLLAGVTYHGSVLVFRVAGPAPPGPRRHPPQHPGQRAVPRRREHPGRPLRRRLRLCRRLRGGLHPGRARPDGRGRPPRGVSQHGGPRHGIHLAGGRLGCPQRPHYHLPRRQRRPADPGPGRPHRGRRLPHRRHGAPVDPSLTRPAARTGPPGSPGQRGLVPQDRCASVPGDLALT